MYVAAKINEALPDPHLLRKGDMGAREELKKDPESREISSVLLAILIVEDDFPNSYDHHANCCITKPVAIHQFIIVVKSIKYFPLDIVKRTQVINSS